MITPSDFSIDLGTTVLLAAMRLREMPAEAAASRPVPTKWSPKEIIGHLIDSASNNHERFVRAGRCLAAQALSNLPRKEWNEEV